MLSSKVKGPFILSGTKGHDPPANPTTSVLPEYSQPLQPPVPGYLWVAWSLEHGLHCRTMLNRVFLAVCLSFIVTSSAFAQSTTTEARQAQSFPVPPVLARAGIVVDGDSGAILASLNPHLQLPMASTTKIMTA